MLLLNAIADCYCQLLLPIADAVAQILAAAVADIAVAVAIALNHHPRRPIFPCTDN